MTEPQWTPARGMLNAAIWLFLKGLLLFGIYAGLVFAAFPLFSLAMKVPMIEVLIVLCFGALIPGWIIGAILSWKLNDTIGFDGFIPALFATTAAAVACYAGMAVAASLRGQVPWTLTLFTLMTIIFAMFTIVKRTWLDPE